MSDFNLLKTLLVFSPLKQVKYFPRWLWASREDIFEGALQVGGPPVLATFSPPSMIYKHSSYIDPPNAQHFLDWKGHGEAVENAAGRGFLEVVEDFDKMEGKKTH